MTPTMKRFDIGDAVRIDIPDETDPDHECLHGRRGSAGRPPIASRLNGLAYWFGCHCPR